MFCGVVTASAGSESWPSERRRTVQTKPPDRDILRQQRHSESNNYSKIQSLVAVWKLLLLERGNDAGTYGEVAARKQLWPQRVIQGEKDIVEILYLCSWGKSDDGRHGEDLII